MSQPISAKYKDQVQPVSFIGLLNETTTPEVKSHENFFDHPVCIQLRIIGCF